MNALRHFLTVFLLSLLISASYVPAQEEYSHSVITDPGVSARCKELLTKRENKIQVKIKAQGLLKRNEELQKVTPEEKKSIQNKLGRIHNQLLQELSLVKLQIENLEEEIVRKGCPGIFL